MIEKIRGKIQNMVTRLINVENLERTNRSFEGNAGAKRGVILDNEE